MIKVYAKIKKHAKMIKNTFVLKKARDKERRSHSE